ncbi:MaoC family dehydratase [Salarchaeum sp. JOR-1]|uniref:MaoC family dehydratase n=1 Tax=Salarchaeum sp. JOR-1 TaxID=2599399 RepID=UPI001198A3ED|nr:MaoC family dehydratase [Salarchaeum sp. JOR-1]QDX39371.1 MaoC family dehydratase [Salarchaeum sp. JOR-1]
MAVAAVGETATEDRSVTRETIDAFAEVTGDDNPLHLDESYAADGPFGGVVAHGMLGAGVVSAALATLPGDIVYLDQDLEFVAPVRPPTTLRARAAVVEDLGNDRVRVETTVRSGPDDDSKTVIEGTATVLSVPHED